MADAPCRYEYEFEDRSIVLRLVQKPVLEPLVRALPAGLSPNAITISGHLVVWAALAGLLAFPEWGAALLFAGLADFAYAWLDCVDGMHARNTGRTSRLGELLDHGLDGLSVPIVPLGFALATRQPPWIVVLATATVSLLHSTTLLHGYRFGRVHLGALGILEGSIAAAALLSGAAFFGLEPLTRPVALGLSISTLALVGLISGSLIALLGMRRLARCPGDVLPLVLVFALVAAWFGLGKLSPEIAGVIVLFAGATQDCRITLARLRRTPLVLWDPWLAGGLGVTVAASALFELPERSHGALAAVLLACVATRGAAEFFAGVGALLREPSRAPAAAQSRPG